MSIDKASSIVYSHMVFRPIIEEGLKELFGDDRNTLAKAIATEVAKGITSHQPVKSMDKLATSPPPRFGEA